MADILLRSLAAAVTPALIRRLRIPKSASRPLLLPVIGPNRSELIAQTGRAPIVKISRMMPPTPVAAPWNGSTALG